MKLGDLVEVKSTGQRGYVTILEGYPYRIAWVDMLPGADENYRYMTIKVEGEAYTFPLNTYNIEDLIIVTPEDN